MFNNGTPSLKWNLLLNNMTVIPAKGRKRVRENLWYLKFAIWKTNSNTDLQRSFTRNTDTVRQLKASSPLSEWNNNLNMIQWSKRTLM